MTASTVNGENVATATTEIGSNLRLKEILQTLPPDCFKKDRLKAWSSVAVSIAAVFLGYCGIAIAPWFLLPIAWIFTGTALTGWFVVAHDCGHRSFANRRWVNDLVGHVLMMPLMYPFHSWRILHNYHHTHTNKLDIDNAWQPFQPELYDQVDPFRRKGYEALRGRFWWIASIVHCFGLHFDLANFAPKDRDKIKLSIGVVVVFGAIAFPLLIATTGIWGFVKFWLLPWMVYHFWMSTFTLVHHTDPEIPFETVDNWNAAQAQLTGTIHCNYPRWVEVLCHDINVHVPHHISTAIPSYKLRMAHQSLQSNWGALMRPESQFSWALMRRITDRCHLYSAETCYQSFQEHHDARQ
ncbi:fatty acid desaturase [Oculatella sp. LEGE 06141]|uniref:fatty acid desaturase n=1 Tax=Oculatella sp. LEGE 06141 TaxID=1828648 RepID=UPI001881B202|nr:fatty acid desaturase [Oculatella sp. LEGE 06141]MBE9179455.1 fatty acid desaturase [Oculatella sp. LEGE 06141]